MPESTWTFLTNHALVLVAIARSPGTRLRDIAAALEITERSAHRIVQELVEAGYVSKHRLGARNFYEVHPEELPRHPSEGTESVGALFASLLKADAADSARQPLEAVHAG